MSRLRSVLRVARVLLVIVAGLALGSLVATLERLRLGGSIGLRQRCSRWFMARLSNALPFRVTVHGELPREPMLWVCNHVSWTDIPLLGQLTPLSFLSKAEVRTWPIAGWLAHKAGTLFIRRGAGDSRLVQRQMGNLLQQGRALLIFPEGTTTDGRALRTFHGRLLSSAIDAGVALQPVAIEYRRAGAPDSIAPFIGDDDLLSHIRRLFAHEQGEVHIHLLAPIASSGKERAALAFEAQAAVQQALFGALPESPAVPEPATAASPAKAA
ncbi:1-acyl-sn-glycerol-3-phosphate acyltransferase [Pseudomonas sp. DTU_2021_1001937_2_SI_NGA_ILE_001]|uniref:1-acyl-sn-glycerol-3-phosphate acyltransferase n=1 Tax=Pseudomonas sp. DTU_2021_1001937_2_SI_NGA_ILE_001 TaxID=3077589 RepID=UPI0028FC32FB|nr:1-acyl-sn-glycerol-3-phosphate acyltransferase [Pseudomonas sp. DTU_2021_1001937_2_SI_NGA_ILE_001]WNW11649.1 1-acyl-sn-glycerol-3-phosphate acyltransferase [Pseudomonas sp. DTU_2021_1001937_2_SI_NGA_ILE_001]